jgi:hypothetical protein
MTRDQMVRALMQGAHNAEVRLRCYAVGPDGRPTEEVACECGPECRTQDGTIIFECRRPLTEQQAVTLRTSLGLGPVRVEVSEP